MLLRACASRDFPVRSDLSSLDANYGLTLSGFGQERRRIGVGEPRRHRRLQVFKDRSPLLLAGRDHRPYPLAPPVPLLAPPPLRDPPADHHEADRLLPHADPPLHPLGTA